MCSGDYSSSIPGSGRIAVGVALADGSDRAPEIVHIADFKAAMKPSAIARDEAQEPGAVPGIESACLGHCPGDQVPR